MKEDRQSMGGARGSLGGRGGGNNITLWQSAAPARPMKERWEVQGAGRETFPPPARSSRPGEGRREDERRGVPARSSQAWLSGSSSSPVPLPCCTLGVVVVRSPRRLVCALTGP